MSAPLLAPHLAEPLTATDLAPCGADLEYAPKFLAFMTLARGSEEQQLGDSIIPSKEPNWRDVIAAGTELLAQTRDLRVAVILTRAAVHVGGLEGFAQALALIQGWLERFWIELHPRLELEGDYDPLMRSNALAGLADPQGVLKALRHSVLIESPVGSLSVGEVERLLAGKPEAQSIVTSSEQLTRIVADERGRNAARFAAIERAAQALKAIETLWTERLESEYWPDLALLSGLLSRLVPLVASSTSPAPAVVNTAHGEESQPIESGHRPGSLTGIPRQIDTRADAFAALAAARAYFERHEPSHPAPLLIRRVERMAEFSFWDMVKELAPEGLNQLQVLAGNSGESNS